jgi:pyruvate dehydrogenase E1 component
MSAVPPSTANTPPMDLDSQETREWMDALSAVIQAEGPERAHFLLEQLLEHARQSSIDMPFSANTAYVNTIEPDQEEHCPGNLEIEERLRAYMRWNAMAMVVKANRHHPVDGGDLGGHIGSFASLATCLARVSTTSGTPKARAGQRARRRLPLHSGPRLARVSMPGPTWKAA